MDLRYEITKQINDFLASKHIKYDKSMNFSDMISAYLHIWDKFIEPRPRTIYISNELKCKLKGKYSSQHTIVTKFIHDFEKGIDINGHLSRGIYKASDYDKLLISWNIHHIHLNSKQAKNDFEMKGNRSALLLFCIITNDKVLFLDIQEHSKKYVFSTYELLKIAFSNNWVEEINAIEMTDVLPGTLEPKVTSDADIQKFRNLNMNISFEFNNKAYMFWGLNTAGSAVKDSLRLCHINKIINKLESEKVCNFEFVGANKDFLGTISVLKDNEIIHINI